MQFNRREDKSLESMPTMCVDTGLGLERIVSVLQGVSSNYDTDLFQGILKVIQHVTSAPTYTGKLGKEDDGQVDMTYRIIADHIRMLTVSLADGVVPSSKGRGYVVRRILRRAAWYGREKLGMKSCFLHELVDSVVDSLGEPYPNLTTMSMYVKRVIQVEEEQFYSTLERGKKEFTKRCRKHGSLSGTDAHILESSFGLPFDLVLIMAESEGIEVDTDGYHQEASRHRERSRREPLHGGA